MLSSARRWLARAWLFALALGLFLLLVPEGPMTPLVPKTAWSAVGFFRCSRPGALQLSQPLLESPELRLWRSLDPHTGRAARGLLESAPFEPTSFVTIPVIGYPAYTEVALYVECLGDGRRIPIATGDLHEEWYERTLWLPRRWCAGPVRVVAASQSPTGWVGVGTPFRSSALSYLKESAPVLLFVHALAFAALLAPGLAAGLWLGSRRALPGPPSLASIPLTCLLGYVTFFLAYFGGVAGGVLASMLAGWLVIAHLRRDRLAAVLREPDDLLPIGLMFFYSLGCVLLLYLADTGAGSWAANYRYSPAIWSSDNQLQQVIAESLYRQERIIGLFGSWRVSDRPPLLAGVLILLRPLWQTVLGVGSNARLYFYFHQVTGIILNSFWVVPVWHLLRALGLSRHRALAAVGLVGATGFALFNSTYIWAKLVGGALALACCMVLLDEDGRYGARRELRAWVAAGLCAGLSLVCHGGVVFGLLPLVPIALRRAARARLWHPIAGLAVAAAVVLPWMLWQRFEDPPGNALVKFAFAGTWGFGEQHVSVWATIRRAYGAISLQQWLIDRWHALASLFGAYLVPELRRMTLVASAKTLAGRLRLSDFLFFFPSLRFLDLGWLALCFLALRRSSDRARSRALWRLASLGLAGIALSVVLLWRIHIVHTLSYLSVLLVCVALSTAIVSLPTWFTRIVVSAQVAYILVVWVLDPLVRAPHVRWGFGVAAVLAAASAWMLLWDPSRESEARLRASSHRGDAVSP